MIHKTGNIFLLFCKMCMQCKIYTPIMEKYDDLAKSCVNLSAFANHTGQHYYLLGKHLIFYIDTRNMRPEFILAK